MSALSEFVSMPDFGRLLGENVNRSTTHTIVASGAVDSVRVGNVTLVRRTSAEEYAEGYKERRQKAALIASAYQAKKHTRTPQGKGQAAARKTAQTLRAAAISPLSPSVQAALDQARTINGGPK